MSTPKDRNLAKEMATSCMNKSKGVQRSAIPAKILQTILSLLIISIAPTTDSTDPDRKGFWRV